MKKICSRILIVCLSFCLIFFDACEILKDPTNNNIHNNIETEKVSTDHQDSSTGNTTKDDTDSSIDDNIDSDTSVSDETTVERYIKIHLQTEYYFQLNNRTIAYSISGGVEFTIKKNQLISTLDLPTPLISQLDKDEYYFSCWGYKDMNGKYHTIENIVATDEIAIDGIISLYPVSVPYHIGPF